MFVLLSGSWAVGPVGRTLPRSRRQLTGSYKQYSQADMARAVELVHQGHSTPQAALECSVPERSLYYKLSKCEAHRGKCRGASVAH